MKILNILLAMAVTFSINAYAEGDLYSDITEAIYSDGDFEIVRTPTGVDLFSKEKFTNSKGKIESVTHLMLEGPLHTDQISSTEDSLMATAHIVQHEVDPDFKYNPEQYQEVYPGLGAAIVDINGINVGVVKYKMNHEPNTYVNRASLHTKNGTYLFALIMHKSGPKNNEETKFMGLLIAAVNSGKL